MALDYPRSLEDGLLESLTVVGGETKIKVAGSFAGGAVTEYTEGAVDASLTGVVSLAEGATDTVRPLQVLELSGNYALKVGIVDGVGSQITSFGGGTQYTEGDVDASITGTAMLMEGAGNALFPAQGTVADGLLVNLGANNDVTVTGTVAATQSGTWILGANSGVDIGDVTINNASGASAVNIQDGGNSITVDNSTLSVVGGGLEATALRVTIASDSTGLISVDDNGGSLTVDGTVAATQSGTWILGSNSGVDIGDVTVNNAAGASAVNIQDGGNSITVDNAALSVTGGGVEASALRVTIANDSTGVLSVDDNGGSLTVDGTVAATQSGSWTVAATQSGTWNINNISGTIALPTGAATETTLSAINAKLSSGTSTLSNVAASATSVTILASNASRKKAVLRNDSTAGCYVKYGATASSTSHTIRLRAGETLIEDGQGLYTGIMDAIWDSATGNMRVTEIT